MIDVVQQSFNALTKREFSGSDTIGPVSKALDKQIGVAHVCSETGC